MKKPHRAYYLKGIYALTDRQMEIMQAILSSETYTEAARKIAHHPTIVEQSHGRYQHVSVTYIKSAEKAIMRKAGYMRAVGLKKIALKIIAELEKESEE